MKEENLFTSESVSEGHPDKVADQIADSILDYCLSIDSESRVACEVFVSTNYVLIGGEITSKAKPNYEQIVKDVMKRVGYVKPEYLFSIDDVQVDVKVKEQSKDIAQGVDVGGAGDQGIMFGYATNETKNYMPLAIAIAHKLVNEATKLRKTGEFKYARPDMKSQVTIDYGDYSSKPRIKTILMSIQHDKNRFNDEFKNYVINCIMKPVAKSFGMNEDFEVLINPTGSFEIGGPAGDTGLTGRKIIVDTYGGSACHGGGAFSGKDPSKVDRSAAYMLRYIAKNLVAAGVADRLELQIGYAIGKPEPVSLNVSTFDTSKYSNGEIITIINKLFDLSPTSIIDLFSLKKPNFRYSDVTNYGHFGRDDINLPWEKLDKVEQIKSLLSK